MGDGLVDSSALASRDGAVVDDVNAAPTTVVFGVDAGLAVRVVLARVDDCLSLFDELTGDEFFDHVGNLEFANSRVQTSHQNKNISVCHCVIEAGRGHVANMGKSDSERHDLRGVDGNENSLEDSLGTFIDPQFVV